MLDFDNIQAGSPLKGVEPNLVVVVVAVTRISADTLKIVYERPDGTYGNRLLTRDQAGAISVATVERPWSFEGDGSVFQLAIEAKRIDLAFLFDPMTAVHTSNVDPLPHQITAVYESMLPRQPLRYVLADDPGAGKTIMAGLYIRELIMRADTRRMLIIAPGSLVEQWRDELFEKFGLEFEVQVGRVGVRPQANPRYSAHGALSARLWKEACDEIWTRN